MTQSDLVKTKVKGRVYTHRLLWGVAKRAAERSAKSQRDQDSRYTACAFGAFAVEAYLNLLIEHIDQNVFADERNFFRGQYAGLRGKLRWTEEKVGFTASGALLGHRANVLTILDLRDSLAHAKPVPYELTLEHPADIDPPFLESMWIEDATTPDHVKVYVGSIAAFVDALHANGREFFSDPHLQEEAFGPCLQSESASGL